MSKRHTYTDEQRQQRRAADEAIREAGDTLLADAEALGAAVNQAAGTVCARLLTYSLRNIALLYSQAQAREIEITDIDSYRGWKARGRYPNQPGLRIVAYNGQDDDSDAQHDAPAESDSHDSAEEDAPARPRFRMISVWDISQTTETEDFEGEPAEPEPAADAAGMLWDNLTEQARALGYTVTAGDAAPAAADDAQIIAIDQPRDAAARARARGPLLLAHTAGRRNPEQADQPGAEDQLRFDLGEFGRATAHVQVDHDTARVFYTVTGSRVNGTFTVSIEGDANAGGTPRELETLKIVYGRAAAEPGDRRYYEPRTDHPHVNGIELVRGEVIDVTHLESLNGWNVHARRAGGGWVPERTADRLAAVLRAILADFLARPDLPHMLATADRKAAARRLARDLEEARQLDRRIAALEKERENCHAAIQRWTALAEPAAPERSESDTPTPIM